jgi:hypothetical protein
VRPQQLAALLTLAITNATASADTFAVTLKVVDSRNQPVAKAEAATFWDLKDGRMCPRADQCCVTDSAGRAVLRIENGGNKRAVLVLSADQQLGGLVGLGKYDDGKELTVPLGPTIRVKGRLNCTELKHEPEWANTTVSAEGFRGYFAQDISKAAAVQFVLPAGKYSLRIYGSDIEAVQQMVTLIADHQECDLGTLDLRANSIAKLKGKTAPELTISDARGVKPTAKLSDYKGKWLYLEFWGYW